MSDADDFGTQAGLDAILPSGATTKVLVEDEVAFIRERSERYTADNHFYNIADIADLDRLITLEMLSWRYGIFLGRGGIDYFNKAQDEPELRRSMSAFSTEIRQLKKITGVDKRAREAERGEASVAGYIEKLRQRGSEFGIHRDRQNAKVLELGMQLIALATYAKNCTPEEQKEFGITEHDLFLWILETFAPTLMILDQHFRQQQRYWIQEM